MNMLRVTRSIINKARVKLTDATIRFRRATDFPAKTVRYTRQFDNISDTVSLLGRGDDEVSVTSELAVDNGNSTIDVLNDDEVVSVKEDDLIDWNGNEVVDANKEIDIDVNQNYLYYGLDLTIGSCFDLTQSDDEKYDDKVERHYKKKFNKKFNENNLAYRSYSMLTICSNMIYPMSETASLLGISDDEIFMASDFSPDNTVASIDVLNGDVIFEANGGLLEREFKDESEAASMEEKDLIDWYGDVNQNYLYCGLGSTIKSCFDLTQSNDEKYDDKVERHYTKKFNTKLSQNKLAYRSTSLQSILTIRSNMVIFCGICLSIDESVSSDSNDSGIEQLENKNVDIGKIDIDGLRFDEFNLVDELFQ
ncbi:unnamed protein product [Caenorhabditis angaria]|uniref:Uncharacterized protein n=1 Tax=Caenorhabditis angaria TaxID=860376 RepID=A0A9P1J2R4_9PELO|nr:unnamed protein product [Caenorhabditis angaria]